jgi:periplasmic protein TonB
MASALASPPPPFPFGSADLKANARKFLERALVISALVHLSVVGAFRVAEQRAAAPAGKEGDLPPWSHTVVLSPPIELPRTNWQPVPETNSGEGRIIPVVERPKFSPIDFGIPGQGPIADPGVAGPNRGAPGNPGPGKPPDDPTRPFTPADTPPVPISAPKPVYTDWLREARIEGKVLLRVLVGTDGLVKKVVVESGPKGLDAAAVEAVRRWTFRPGLSDGRPVEVWVAIPILFRLGE